MKPEDFGKYLRSLRKERQLTTRQVELYSGVSNSYLSQIENGKRGIPSPKILEKLSTIYNVPYEELMMTAGYLPDIRELGELGFDGYIKEHDDSKVMESTSTHPAKDNLPPDVIPIGKMSDVPEPIINDNKASENKLKRKVKAIVNELKDLWVEEKASSSESLVSTLNLISIIAGTGPIKPRLELADVLDNKEIEITEGGEILGGNKRKRLIDAIKNPDGVTEIFTVPLLGNIRAGIPLLSEQNKIGEIDIPADLAGKADFALNVRGDSMIGAGISDSDIVVCREDKDPHSGQIVVALVNNDETTLKYYIKENGHAVLRAANPEYKDIELKSGDTIQGHVVRIFKEPPPVNQYREFIYFKEEHLQGWNEVIEKAVTSGIRPSIMAGFIEAHVEIAKRLTGK